MKRIAGIAFFSLLIHLAGHAGFSQLRSPSEYNQDGINLDNTYFVLYKSKEADYGSASQWTQSTARTYADKAAFLKWHFKDGSVAYVSQSDHVGDIGMISQYLLTDESATLTDDKGKPVQPMTLDNYPVKVELWMGAPGGSSAFNPEILVDAACSDQKSIQYGYAYYFSACP